MVGTEFSAVPFFMSFTAWEVMHTGRSVTLEQENDYGGNDDDEQK